MAAGSHRKQTSEMQAKFICYDYVCIIYVCYVYLYWRNERGVNLGGKKKKKKNTGGVGGKWVSDKTNKIEEV